MAVPESQPIRNGDLQLGLVAVWTCVGHAQNSTAAVSQVNPELVVKRRSPDGLTTFPSAFWISTLDLRGKTIQLLKNTRHH